MGKKCFLVLAEQKSVGGQQQPLRGVSHYVHGCEGSLEVTLTPALPPSDSRFRCPHLPPAHLLFLDLLPFFSPTVTNCFHLCFRCHLLTDYLSVNTCAHMCPQLHTRTAKHHGIASRLLSETHVWGGNFFRSPN